MGDRLSQGDIERMIQGLTSAMDFKSPYQHLYEWLQEKDPMLFKQWEAVYAIIKANEDY